MNTTVPRRLGFGGSRLIVCALFFAASVLLLSHSGSAAAATGQAVQPSGMDRINHLVVIYQENWSFDSLYGKFPGANGFASAGTAVQVARDGTPYAALPQPIDTSKQPPAPDPRFPADLPVAPFDIAPIIPTDQTIPDLVHRFYQEQLQINGGRMDRFAAWSDAAGLVMGYYDATNLPEGQLAQQYTIADNFFHGAFGGSFLNHFWLVCACTPAWLNAPADLIAQVDDLGVLVKDGAVTPDGYTVNTSQPMNAPFASTAADPTRRLPPQTMPTIGDRLTDKGVSWAWYSGGWNDAVAGNPDRLFQYHHQPFNYFVNYADGKPARVQHLRDIDDFRAALSDGSLPAVSFVKPLGPNNEHPGYANLLQGQLYVADLVRAVQGSSSWKDTAIIITYDENGGFWDHVAPPAGDRWGPGSRVPTIIVSPYAKRGYVDHTQYDTTSILKFIETRWGVAALGSRDAAASNLLNAFDFSQAGDAAQGSSGAPFTFGLWGDMPYARSGDGPKMANLRQHMNGAQLAFSVFDGDIKDGSSRCDDSEYTNAIDFFNGFEAPMIYVPGDNEWTDCHRTNNGGYNNLERLDHVRRTMFATAESFGQRRMTPEHQGPLGGQYVENTRWVYGDVVFAGLNVPGSNNNKINTATECTNASARAQADCDADNAEYEARDAATISWMREVFALARQRGAAGIMLIMQADPGFDLPETEANERTSPTVDGYTNFLAALVEETQRFTGQVVLVHGDTHFFKVDKPLLDQAHLVANFTRVETFGSPNVHWVRVDVNPRSPAVFTFTPMLVPGN